MRLFRTVVVMGLSFGFSVSAAETARPKLECPVGTKALVGDRARETQGCLKQALNKEWVLHGPFVVFRSDGTVEAKGQYVEGFRQGLWSFYNAQGRKTGETEFVRGVYHGARTQYFPDGKVRAKENWVEGRREGLQRVYDEGGRETAVEYRHDTPSMASR